MATTSVEPTSGRRTAALLRHLLRSGIVSLLVGVCALISQAATSHQPENAASTTPIDGVTTAPMFNELAALYRAAFAAAAILLTISALVHLKKLRNASPAISGSTATIAAPAPTPSAPMIAASSLPQQRSDMPLVYGLDLSAWTASPSA